MFLLISSSSDLRTGKGGGVGNPFVSLFFFLIEALEYFADAFLCQ